MFYLGLHLFFKSLLYLLWLADPTGTSAELLLPSLLGFMVGLGYHSGE